MGLIEQGKAIRRSRERLNRTAAALASLAAEQQLLSRNRSQSTPTSARREQHIAAPQKKGDRNGRSESGDG